METRAHNARQGGLFASAGSFLQMQHCGSDAAHPGRTRAYRTNEPSQIEPGNRGQDGETETMDIQLFTDMIDTLCIVAVRFGRVAWVSTQVPFL